MILQNVLTHVLFLKIFRVYILIGLIKYFLKAVRITNINPYRRFCYDAATMTYNCMLTDQ